MGLFAALVGMASNRLAMAIIPAMGRNHFFVLYSVFASVALGLAPILWGLIIDLIGDRQAVFLGFNWTHYTIFLRWCWWCLSRRWGCRASCTNPKAASLESLLTDIIIESPQRLWLRFWSRD